jgi:hypothetical protein
MRNKDITKVINFLVEYRDKRKWSIGIEKGLTDILSSIELIDTAHNLVALGYTLDEIKVMLPSA